MIAVHKGRSRYLLSVGLLLLLGATSLLFFRKDDLEDLRSSWLPNSPQSSDSDGPLLGNGESPGFLYYPPTQPFPLKIARYNQPPTARPRTPLFIGFTNNNALLCQCVLSYIAAGWPPEDIIVVDNTGTMDSNPRGKLAKNNYFYLDYSWLRRHGVSILQTPTLLSFSQMQNFFLRTSIAHGWPNFFWSHMDVVVVADEHWVPFRSFYERIVQVVKENESKTDWAIKWFSCGVKACDMLVLVNVDSWRKIGQWDPFIPYYFTDCDAFSRMALSGYSRAAAGDHIGAGAIFDVASTLDHPESWLFPQTPDEEPNSPRFQRLWRRLEEMEHAKLSNDAGRNEWQESHGKRIGGGEDWSYDPSGFRFGWWSMSDVGKSVYRKKWDTEACELDGAKVPSSQMWKKLEQDAKEAAEKAKQEAAKEKEKEGA